MAETGTTKPTEADTAADKAAAAKPTGTPAAKGFGRRDLLRDIEKSVQVQWEGKYNEDAPEDTSIPKYLITFPYPYMNGKLHLGHAFTVTRAEFAARFERMKGKKVLFPFAFHCTGMPIKACADRLTRELAAPAVVPAVEEESVADATPAPTPVQTPSTPQSAVSESGEKKVKSKKSKVQQKTGTAATQYKILQTMGIADEEIPKFADANYWLEYFPPLAKRDLAAMGCAIDFRRSFVTTDLNGYYDMFVRWQFNKLRAMDLVKYGKRYDIFSPIDGQPCADHDRASGEGVGTQEYVLIKLELVQPFPESLKGINKKVYLVAGTLRPETMYGQTNCWILPSGEYGAFEINDKEVFVCCERAARNMAFQGLSPVAGQVTQLATVKGQELVGCYVKAPLSKAKNGLVPVLPMTTISLDKATGVVTSVPSDAPDDWQSLKDLQDNETLRKKLGVSAEVVQGIEVIPIINVPGMGNLSAKTACEELGVKNQNDRDKLVKAKEMTYMKGFYEGVFILEEWKDKKVQDVKPVVREQMIARGEAVVYCEPESQVMSRSGDECVVALCDQWYLTYGEDEWRKKTEAYLEGVRTWHPETKGNLRFAINWVHQWACSRSYGLGTRLPWDPKWLIESLSDSTIYMAFYTIAHILQKGDMYGRAPNDITSAHCNDAFFDYVLLEGTYEACTEAWTKAGLSAVPKNVLDLARREFRYWYPVDMRVSGKDLVNNHLTMYLYNHAAIFPAHQQPRGIRANGHVLVNGEKMSKSKGNFITLEEAIERYSADAMRFACADAGDGLDDPNFVDDTANKTVLRLTGLLSWARDVMGLTEEVPTDRQVDVLCDTTETTFFDRVFSEEITKALNLTFDAYDNMQFRDAMKAGFFDFLSARDTYRQACGGRGMRRDLCVRFIEAIVICMSPVCPHICCHIWETVLKSSVPFVQIRWPERKAVNFVTLDTAAYLEEQIKAARQKLTVKGKSTNKYSAINIYVARKYPDWQLEALDIMRSAYNHETKTLADDKVLLAQVKSKDALKPHMKKVMPFIKYMMDQVKLKGERVMAAVPLVDELSVLQDNIEMIKRSLDVNVNVYDMCDAALAGDDATKAAAAVPTQPVMMPVA